MASKADETLTKTCWNRIYCNRNFNERNKDLQFSSQAREYSVVWPGLRQSPSVNKCARPHA